MLRARCSPPALSCHHAASAPWTASWRPHSPAQCTAQCWSCRCVEVHTSHHSTTAGGGRAMKVAGCFDCCFIQCFILFLQEGVLPMPRGPGARPLSLSACLTIAPKLPCAADQCTPGMHARMAAGCSAHIYTWPAHACMHVAGRWRLRRHSSGRCTSCGTVSTPTTTRWVGTERRKTETPRGVTHACMHACSRSGRSANACVCVQHVALHAGCVYSTCTAPSCRLTRIGCRVCLTCLT